ncbi:hypothetical protein TEA_027608 [Camellia sinensis var. sinensis]|uniref:Kinesin motor domain-containing protein n=1 Tax=Camellia sinensis var. sinensis TaxID=542762 RepID=A0A4S4EXB8_CAMSN|nr:hypothetical protein TEA_027608 [Camellia sinensis var. sinensis]
MGSISGDELTHWDARSNAHEEKIFVSVRLRPLNDKEIARYDVSDWECINNTTIIFKNNTTDRSLFPTAYTFDSFSGSCRGTYVPINRWNPNHYISNVRHRPEISGTALLNSPHVKGKLSCEHTLVGQQGSRLPTMSKKEAAEVKHGGYPMALPPTPRCIKWNGDGEL